MKLYIASADVEDEDTEDISPASRVEYLINHFSPGGFQAYRRKKSTFYLPLVDDTGRVKIYLVFLSQHHFWLYHLLKSVGHVFQV